MFLFPWHIDLSMHSVEISRFCYFEKTMGKTTMQQCYNLHMPTHTASDDCTGMSNS